MAELTSLLDGNRVSGRQVQLHRLAKIAGIYIAARLVTTAFLLIASAIAQPGSRFGSGGSITRFITGWDGTWYWRIAEVGYPAALPVSESGSIAENEWAFMPVYAWTARIVGLPFGSWAAGATIVSLVFGFLACVALFRLLGHRIGEGPALWAVVFFACGPVAAMFHVGYAESMFLALLYFALDALQRRRYAWLYLLVPIMAFTRPGVLPFALTVALVGIWRLFRRRQDPLLRRDVVHILAIGAVATVCGFGWQWIAAAVTGVPDAYLQTELSWRRNWLPDSTGTFFPFDGWVLGMNFWFGQWGVPPVLGWVVFGLILVVVLWLLLRSRAVRAVGMELRLWSASYLLYILAVFFPQSSTLRLMLPLSPMWGALAVRQLRIWRPIILVGCLAYQWVWISGVYAMGITITQVP